MARRLFTCMIYDAKAGKFMQAYCSSVAKKWLFWEQSCQKSTWKRPLNSLGLWFTACGREGLSGGTQLLLDLSCRPILKVSPANVANSIYCRESSLDSQT